MKGKRRKPATPASAPVLSADRPTTLAPPLEMLCFLIPLIAAYEIACLLQPRRVIAYGILQRFLEFFGPVGVWAPGLAIVAILLATHVVSGRPWTVRWRRVWWMYLESALAAVPLLLLSWTVPLLGLSRLLPREFFTIAQGIGAGVYEELVFRLGLISLIVLIGADLLRRDRRIVVVVAILGSSLAFAAHHHAPVGAEPFSYARFTFRAAAGVYLAAIFWYRGYGLAAGCHAAYNSILVLSGFMGRG